MTSIDTPFPTALDGTIFTEPAAYADPARWHEIAARLRAKAPVTRVEVDGFTPFWAVTRHADVLDVSRRHQDFHNTERSVLMPDFVELFIESVGMDPPRSLVHLDGHVHREHRRVTEEWFRPKVTASWQPAIDQIAEEFAARLDDFGGRCDFARDIAAPYAIHVIMSIFGVPESDERLMLELTQGLFGSADPEYLGDLGDPGQLLVATVERFREYFGSVAAARRVQPTDDLATVIANGQIDGCPMGDPESLWYFIIVATAGHDTTSFALSGGFEALLRHPEQLAALRDRPELVGNATDEMIRWTSPVRHFLRYALADTEVAGVPIPEGDRVLLSYLAANRDETVFERPHEFDITRPDAANQLAFGLGVHYCLGAQVARREIRSMLPRLLGRMEHVELDGEPDWSESIFVGGVKHLPIRYRLRG